MSRLLLQVKELLGRNLDAYEIAHRLHVSIDHVQTAIDTLSQII